MASIYFLVVVRLRFIETMIMMLLVRNELMKLWINSNDTTDTSKNSEVVAAVVSDAIKDFKELENLSQR